MIEETKTHHQGRTFWCVMSLPEYDPSKGTRKQRICPVK